jgi:hypothetical protein
VRVCFRTARQVDLFGLFLEDVFLPEDVDFFLYLQQGARSAGPLPHMFFACVCVCVCVRVRACAYVHAWRRVRACGLRWGRAPNSCPLVLPPPVSQVGCSRMACARACARMLVPRAALPHFAAIEFTPFGVEYPKRFGLTLDSTSTPVCSEPEVLCAFKASIVVRGLARAFRCGDCTHPAPAPGAWAVVAALTS